MRPPGRSSENWKQARGVVAFEIHRIVHHAETVLQPQLFVLTAQLRDLAQDQRQPHGVERGAPLLPVLESLAQNGQALGLGVGAAGALVGDVGGGVRTLEQEIALARIARLDLQDGARKPQPVGAVIGRNGDQLAEHHHAGAVVVFAEGDVGFLAQGRCCLVHLTGVALDLRFQLDRRIVEVAAMEGLVGGERRNRDQGDKRGREAGAEQMEHRQTSRCGRQTGPPRLL